LLIPNYCIKRKLFFHNREGCLVTIENNYNDFRAENSVNEGFLLTSKVLLKIFLTSILHTEANHISVTDNYLLESTLFAMVVFPRRWSVHRFENHIGACHITPPDARNIFKPFEITSSEKCTTNRFSRASGCF